jgi:hypothetical protein
MSVAETSFTALRSVAATTVPERTNHRERIRKAFSKEFALPVVAGTSRPPRPHR